MRRTIYFASIFALSIGCATASFVSALAQDLDVPVIEHADEDLDTCSYGQVSGLKADGDGFLAVRSGPGSGFTKLDELKNHDKIWLYDHQGDWFGIVYDTDHPDCSPIDADREVKTDGKKGWVHKNWIALIAG